MLVNGEIVLYFNADSWFAATGAGTSGCVGCEDRGFGGLVAVRGRGGIIAVPKGANPSRVSGSGVRFKEGDERRVGGDIFWFD